MTLTQIIFLFACAVAIDRIVKFIEKKFKARKEQKEIEKAEKEQQEVNSDTVNNNTAI